MGLDRLPQRAGGLLKATGAIQGPAEEGERVVTSSSETANFTNFALFSPDGRTVLTSAGSSDNRLQLWRNPVVSPKKRAAELRQYVWTESPTTCAAFAPQAPFIVTGTRDRNVVVWGMPTQAELSEPVANATIINVGEILENSTRPVRVIADVFKPTPGLLPNGTATMVVHPVAAPTGRATSRSR